MCSHHPGTTKICIVEIQRFTNPPHIYTNCCSSFSTAVREQLGGLNSLFGGIQSQCITKNMNIGLILILAVQACAHAHTVADILEAAAVLKSNARTAFHSDQHFASKIESLHSLVTDRTSASRQSSHPFLVRMHDDCQGDCSLRYVQQFSSKRIVHLNKKFLLITASAAEMESFAAENTGTVKFHFPMIPEMKIDAAVANVAHTKNCELSEVGIYSRHADKHIAEAPVRTYSDVTLRIVLTPLAHKEVADFLKFAHDSSKLSANHLPFTYHYATRQRTGEKQYLEVTLSDCAHVEGITSMFARRREVMWIERKYPAFTHNRWAKGVCDTADATSKPLETNSAANFTGRGDIIGVIDTGIDMKNCYFRDDDVATPYVWADDATTSTPNFNHRKVVQYYMHDKGPEGKSDDCDDSSGHGTHVSGSKYCVTMLFVFSTPCACVVPLSDCSLYHCVILLL